ncbi:MAG: radical SAM protein [Elusimicrobiota bacterium]|nr:radical SAM protein [Elusimicrobiota bacterium]
MSVARRLELHLSYTCGQSCAFCSESARMAKWRHAPLRGEEISAVLLARRKAGFSHVTFTGGEPTAHVLLPAALAAARKLGFNTYLTTNGGRFAEEAYAAEVLPLVDELCLSVHGPDAATHDAAACTSGSFDRAMKALANIERHGASLYLLTNTVVTRRNWDKLEEILAMLTTRPKIRHILLSNVAPEGRALKDYAALAVPLSQWRGRVPSLARPFETNGVVLRLFGLPLCVLGGRVELSNDAHYSPRVTVERRAAKSGPGLVAIESRDASRRRGKPLVCRSCADRGDCAGVFDRYLSIHGGAELAPRRGS